MAYKLEDAVTKLKDNLGWLTRAIDSEPLEGLFDGTNCLFHIATPPMCVTPAPKLYQNDGAEVTTNWSVTNYTTGTVTFTAAPTATLYASYTTQAMSDSQLLGIAKAGFDEMESRYPRSLYLVESGGSTYVSSDSTNVIDPVLGSSTFGTSSVQIDFLLACVEYRFWRSQLGQAAQGAINYREERVGGLQVDLTKRAEAIKLLLEEANRKIESQQVAVSAASGETAFGTFIPGAQSNSYRNQMRWWETSDQAKGW